MFKKTFGNIVPAGEFPNGYGRASVMLNEREQSSEGIIRSHRELHQLTIQMIVYKSKLRRRLSVEVTRGQAECIFDHADFHFGFHHDLNNVKPEANIGHFEHP